MSLAQERRGGEKKKVYMKQIWTIPIAFWADNAIGFVELAI